VWLKQNKEAQLLLTTLRDACGSITSKNSEAVIHTWQPVYCAMQCVMPVRNQTRCL